MWVRWVVIGLSLAGCRQILGLDDPTLTPTLSDASIDAPDGGTCIAASAECLGDTLRSCAAAGASPVDTTCTWGCLATATPHCGSLQPAGGVVTATDLSTDPGLQPITIAAGTTIDTDTGSISGLRAAGVGVMSGIEFSMTATGGVFQFRSLTISAATAIVGSRAAVLIAQGDVTIGAMIDARGTCLGNAPGPGGSAGGLADANGAGPGAGTGGALADEAGGGGGHAAPGGRGGIDGGGGPAGGPAYGDAAITTLRGGSGGGGGGGAANESGAGGGGGGAVQIIAGASLSVLSTGGINGGGCGGAGALNSGAGGGGGAGGTILLEAPAITIAGTLAVNGGGGGGGNSGAMAGGDGLPSRSAALGGQATGTGGDGGDGGVGASPGGNVGQDDNTPGGGGGARGRIRFNTRSGTATIIQGGVMSPSVTDPLPATQGAASVQ